MSKYERVVVPNFEKIKELRRSGQTEANIAKYLGLAYNTFQLYKKQHVELQELMDESKQMLIEELENTMYQTAMGKIKVRETKRYIQQNGGKEQVRVEETVKELPPNPTLLIFTLKNMAPQKWRDVQQLTGVSVDTALENMEKVFTELREKLDDVEPPKTHEE